MTSIFLQYMLFLCWFLFGLFAGLLPYWEIDREFGVGDIFRAAVTILVAYVLGVVFHRNFSEVRAEKDLLLAQIKEIDGAMKATRTLFVRACCDGKPEQLDREILASLKNVSGSLSILEEAAAECLAANQLPTLTEARECYRECRSLLTRRFLEPDAPYIGDTYTQAESTFSEFHKLLFRFSLYLNRHNYSKF